MQRTEMLSPASALVNRQTWLDRVGDGMAAGVGAALAAAGPQERRLRNLLHGTWLGHPLHPVLTDVPVGAWTAAAAFDTLDALGGQRELRVAADAAVAIGLAAGVKAAATGLADWSHTNGTARRVGVAHALLNGTATLLYGGSLVARLSGGRALGRALALVGYGIMGASAYLGGELVFHHRIGIDHARDQDLPADWVPVLAAGDLVESQPRRVDAAGVPVLLVRRGGASHALGETCSHLGGPLAEGKLEDDCIVCPWHGSRFALVDGSVRDGPATYPVPALAVRERNGQLEVRAADRHEQAR